VLCYVQNHYAEGSALPRKNETLLSVKECEPMAGNFMIPIRETFRTSKECEAIHAMQFDNSCKYVWSPKPLEGKKKANQSKSVRARVKTK
jgi:hypothetical protein